MTGLTCQTQAISEATRGLFVDSIDVYGYAYFELYHLYDVFQYPEAYNKVLSLLCLMMEIFPVAVLTLIYSVLVLS